MLKLMALEDDAFSRDDLTRFVSALHLVLSGTDAIDRLSLQGKDKMVFLLDLMAARLDEKHPR